MIERATPIKMAWSRPNASPVTAVNAGTPASRPEARIVYAIRFGSISRAAVSSNSAASAGLGTNRARGANASTARPTATETMMPENLVTAPAW